jgi:hypothetical protein
LSLATGRRGGRDLTDEQKKELYGYSDEKLEKERQDDEAAQEALSDVMKDLIAGPLKAGRWVWKCIKGVLTKVWKETDPGESFPEE